MAWRICFLSGCHNGSVNYSSIIFREKKYAGGGRRGQAGLSFPMSENEASDQKTQPPGLAQLEAMAREALKTIPHDFGRHVKGVVIRVVDFPDADIVREMGLESPFDLLGLYQGVSLDRKSIIDVPGDMDMIFLYRRPILDYWCETGDDLYRIVRHVLIHEIGHHFGLSDADMHRIEGQ